MSNNAIPKNLKVLLAMAEDAAGGCLLREDEIGLRAVNAADLFPAIEALKGKEAVPPEPPLPGLIALYGRTKSNTAKAKAALKAKDAEVNRFLTDARDTLKKVLGTPWSPSWVMAGFSVPGSTAVPHTQDDRFASLSSLTMYLKDHPTHEVPGGGVYPELTSARAALLHKQISDCRSQVNFCEAAQVKARNDRDAGAAWLRALMIALVNDLKLRLGPADSRWEALGLNIPANRRAPEPARELMLSEAGTGRVLVEWKRGRRSNNNRILVQIVGVDEDWRECGKSGNTTETLLLNLPPGATLRVKIIALNGSLAATTGPEAEMVVG